MQNSRHEHEAHLGATIVAVVLTLACITAIMIVVMPKFKSMQKLTDKLNGVSRENLTGIRVVRAYNAEGYQEEKFEKANVAITKTQLFTGRVMALMSPIMTLIMNGISLALYWIGASLINKGATDFPTISSFMMLASQIIMAFMMLMMMFVLLPRAQVSAERINRVLGTEVSVKDPETDAERTETGHGGIQKRYVPLSRLRRGGDKKYQLQGKQGRYRGVYRVHGQR